LITEIDLARGWDAQNGKRLFATNRVCPKKITCKIFNDYQPDRKRDLDQYRFDPSKQTLKSDESITELGAEGNMALGVYGYCM
jgi:hypothetical protein